MVTFKVLPCALRGLPVSDGVVIGRVMVLDDDGVRVAKRPILPEATGAEVVRLDQAVKAALGELAAFQVQAEKEMGKETAKIFQVHQAMLKDPGLVGPMKAMIQKELVSAEFAAHTVLAALAARFRSMGDSAFGTKVNDIDDLDLRLHRHLVGEQKGRLKSAAPGTVVVARDLTPSQAAGFDRTRILGFVTDLGDALN